MRIYKNLSDMQALSFDLDDTLYPNVEVIAKAELAMQQRIRQLLPHFADNTPQFWWQQRKALAALDPSVRHDVSRWRLLAVEQGFKQHGIAACEAAELAELAMSAFLQQRTQIRLAPHIRPLLQQLAERWPLVAITNGNADIQQMGIGDLFQFSLRAGPDGRMKPWPDLFQAAATRLNLPLAAMLHIGDHPLSDVQGALNAGCQAAWFNPSQLPHHKMTTLPQLEFSDLSQLLLLLP